MHCAVRSTPHIHHFVVNVMNVIVLSVLTHTLVGTKLSQVLSKLSFTELLVCCVL